MYFYHWRAELFRGARFGVIQLLHAIAARSLGATVTEVATLASALGLGMVGSMFVAALMRSRPKLPYVIVPALLANACLLAVAFAGDLKTYLILVSLHMFFDPLSLPAMSGIQRANYPAAHRAGIIGHIRSWFMFLAITTAFLVGLVLDFNFEDQLQAYRVIVPLGGVMGLFSLLLLRRIKVRGERRNSENRAAPDTAAGGLGRVLRDWRFWIFQSNFLFFGFANLMLVPIVPVYLVKHDVPYHDIANILVVLPGLLTMLTLGAWGRLLDRWNPISMRTLTMAIWSMQPLLLYFAPQLSAAFGISLVAPVYLAYFFRGLAFGGSSLIWFLGAMYFASEDDVPIYMGLHLALTGLRMILAPQAAAWLVEVYSFETTFLVSYGLMIFALLLTVVLGSIEKRAGRLLSFAEREEQNEPLG